MTKGEEGRTSASDGVEEEMVAGIACGAFYWAGSGEGRERRDTPRDVGDVVRDTKSAGVVCSGEGHFV